MIQPSDKFRLKQIEALDFQKKIRQIQTGFRHQIFMRELASFLCDIGKQFSPRYDAAEPGIPSGAILFA